MKGRDLKQLVAQIPDDAEVQILGADQFGYDTLWASYTALCVRDDGVHVLISSEDATSVLGLMTSDEQWIEDTEGRDHAAALERAKEIKLGQEELIRRFEQERKQGEELRATLPDTWGLSND